ncbi:transposase, partial [Sansalvadorimonas verongulae]|uniref:transposase n=1 Tax=Sansalvadorimonas verongulae TaxID=2172824 RepID=UPI0038B57011
MQYAETGQKQRCFGFIQYAAKSWKNRKRKIIIKAEFTEKMDNNRYVVTNLKSGSAKLTGPAATNGGLIEKRLSEKNTVCPSSSVHTSNKLVENRRCNDSKYTTNQD